jgi:glycosyltransferase 2 family protein
VNTPQRSLALRLSGLAIAVLLLWSLFREVRFDAVFELLDDRLAVVLLLLVPCALVNLVDAKGWQWLLQRFGATVRLRDVFATHLAGEAAIMSLPMGFAVSEPLRPFLLGRRAGVAVGTAVASTLARKVFLIFAEGLVVALAFFLGLQTFRRVSEATLGTGGLEWLTAGAALLLCSMGWVMGVSFGQGVVATKVLGLLRRIPPGRLAKLFERRGEAFTATDRALQRFFATPPRYLLPVLGCYLGVWLLESCEAYVVLRVLGARISFVEALSMEAALSFLRSVVVVLPAGLGVQDLGYVVFLRALGVQEPLVVGAAFSVIKRCKEGLWIGIGYACWFVTRQKPVPIAEETLA